MKPKASRNNIPLMLLGPGKELLDHRKRVKKELVKMGYNEVIIMEEIGDQETDSGMDEKFGRIADTYNPALFIAFFHSNKRGRPVNMEAVIFEIGYICGKYGSRRIGERLRILSEKKYDWEKTTAYIKTLFPKAPRVEFDDSQAHSKASKMIHLLVLNALSIGIYNKPKRRRNYSGP